MKKEITIPFGLPERLEYIPVDNRNGWKLDEVTEASFAAWYDREYLHVHFRTSKAPLFYRYSGDQSPVSRDSCVEVFVKPHPDGEYWNFEFNVGGSVNASHRFVRPEPTRLTSPEIATIRRRAVPEVALGTEISGNGNSWDFEADIPWELMGVVPAKDMRLQANFYACASEGNPPYCLSWAPIDTPEPDFHRPEFFGDIVLG